MATDRQQPERGDFPRVCDYCGHRFMWKELRMIEPMKWACPDDTPGLTATQISRINARAKPLIVRPRRYAKDYIQTPIYQLAEAQAFNFLASVAPASEKNGSSDPLSAAWAAIYMADVINQAKRPKTWTATATTVVKRCCDYLITRQAGGGLLPQAAISDAWYGGLTSNIDPFVGTEFSTTTWSTPMTIAAGIAFLKAYAALGTVTYLEAAKRCATYVRHVQSGAYALSGYTVFPPGGGRYYIGGLSNSMTDFTGLLSRNYFIADVAGLWFLKLLSDVVGASTVYGDTALTGYYQPNAASLSTMIADLTTFAVTGPRDNTLGGALTTPLSATEPRGLYQAARNGLGGLAFWQAADLTAADLSLCLIGLYMANGMLDSITTMLNWIRAATPNPNNLTPASLPEDQVVLGITGTYDPALCPASSLSETVPFTESDFALYDWSSFGLLAPILSVVDPGQMRISKDTLSTAVRFSANDVGEVFLTQIGESGLSLQPIYLDTTGHLVGLASNVAIPATGIASTVRVARTALAYHVDPGHSPALRGN